MSGQCKCRSVTLRWRALIEVRDCRFDHRRKASEMRFLGMSAAVFVVAYAAALCLMTLLG